MPDLGLTRNRRNNAYLLLAKSVDDGRFSCIWVANHADRNLFAVAMEGAKLAEERNERTLAEAIIDGSVEGKCGKLATEVADPCSLSNVSFVRLQTR